MLTALWRVAAGLQSGHQESLILPPIPLPPHSQVPQSRSFWAFLLSTTEHSADSTKIRPFRARSITDTELYTTRVLNNLPETRRSWALGEMLKQPSGFGRILPQWSSVGSGCPGSTTGTHSPCTRLCSALDTNAAKSQISFKNAKPNSPSLPQTRFIWS